jgi:hypothetical protein
MFDFDLEWLLDPELNKIMDEQLTGRSLEFSSKCKIDELIVANKVNQAIDEKGSSNLADRFIECCTLPIAYRH